MEIGSGGVSVDGSSIQTNSAGQIYAAVPDVYQLLGEAACEIIELQANATITPLDHDYVIVDTASDSNGLRNTISTSLSTASYDSTNKKYLGQQSGTATATLADAGSAADHVRGYKIRSSVAFNQIVVTKHASVTAATAAIYNTSGVSQASAAFSSNVATITFAGAANTDYWVGCGNSATTFYMTATPSLPIVNGILTVAAGVDVNDLTEGATLFHLASVVVNAAAAATVVADSLGTISGTVTHVELVCSCPNRESGDAVTFDITNGTTTLTGQALNTKVAWTGASNPNKLTVNLTPKSSSPTLGTPSMKSYALKLWKA